MIKHFCDMCGCEYDGGNYSADVIAVGYFDIDNNFILNEIVGEDICPECIKKIEKIIKGNSHENH